MDVKNTRLNSDDFVDFNDISIESLGAHIIFGEVCEDTMKDAAEFVLKSNQLYPKREISIFVNTVGGTCADGFALIDLMHVSRVPVKTIGLGNVISMGVLIVCAGTKGKRIMTRNTAVMAHQFSTTVSGKFHDLMADFKSSLYLKSQFIEHFKRHSNMDQKQIEDILFGPSDRWLSPSECKKFGLIDAVVDELPEFNLEPHAQTLQRGARRRGGRSKRRSRE